MAADLLLLLTLAAGPAEGSSWKLVMRTREHLAATAKAGGRKQSAEAIVTFDETMIAQVDTVKDGQPLVASLQPVGDTQMPAISVRDDSGAAQVIYPKKKKKEMTSLELNLIRSFVGRLVIADAERSAMSTCSDANHDAVERWLRKMLAAANALTPSEVTLSDVTSKCTETKGIVRHAVSLKASLPRGLMTAAYELKGTVTVDPAVWVTLWNLSGPTSLSGENAHDLKVKSMVSTSFSLQPMR